MNKWIPLSIPNMEGNEKKYMLDAVEQAWVSTGGMYITEFERRIADYIHVNNVAACQSGTSALHLSLIECGVGRDDAVLVPTLTFIAAVNPVLYQLAEPIFMDCDNSLCIDPVKLAEFCAKECEFEKGKLIFQNKHIKAIVVVHIFGNMADMESIMDIANQYNLRVVEDATEALGTCYVEGIYKGRYAGTIGDFGAFSFNGNKIITTGGGGAVTARNSKLVDHMRYLSTQAKNDPQFYIHDEVGYNYRMTNLQAALGVAQIEKLPEFIERKHKNYQLYQEIFRDCELCGLLDFRNLTDSNRWFYALEIDRDKIKVSLSEIIIRLEKRGIQTRAIWGLIHEQIPYKKYKSYKIEKAYYYSKCILNIPTSTNITKEDIEYVGTEIKKLLKELADESE